jgi:signal transduction histidine kinase
LSCPIGTKTLRAYAAFHSLLAYSAYLRRWPPTCLADAEKGLKIPMTAQPIAGAEAANTWSIAAAPEDRSHHLRTQFLRRVAHDIASPTGVTMTVLEELAAESHRPELVAMARRGLRRLLRLSEQLALAADFEAGSVAPDTTAHDLRSVVDDAIEQATTIDGRRGVTVEAALPEARVVADVDRRLVGSIVREVIGNALRLASSRVRVTLETSGSEATVLVEDDGPGFAADVLPRIGERFVPGLTSRGLGLSLSIAKDVLDAHGGSLRTDTSTLPPGRRGIPGAAVVITLPLA